MKATTKASSDVSNGIAENGGCNRDMFFVDPDEKNDGHSRAKITVSKVPARTREKNASKRTAAHFVSVE